MKETFSDQNDELYSNSNYQPMVLQNNRRETEVAAGDRSSNYSVIIS